MYVTDDYVLLVGMTEYSRQLRTVFAQLRQVDTGLQALQQFRLKIPAALIAPWNLPDMPNGLLFRRILSSGNFLSTVALIDSTEPDQEIAARSLGITVVVDNGISSVRLGELINHLSDAKAATGT